MANQLKMADIQCIVTLHGRGWSRRRIARELGIDRETVARHLRLSVLEQEAGPKPAIALAGAPGNSLPGPGTEIGSGANPAIAPTGNLVETERKPAKALPGSPSQCAPWRETIAAKLEQGLTAQRIYQDLAGEHGYCGSYYSVCRLVRKLDRAGTKGTPFRRMECEPGAEAQVDFGRGAPITTSEGKRRSTWVFRIVLSHSRKGYAEAVHRQTTDDFLRCLENAFASFVGVPRTLVIDNLRAAVKRADWFDPELCPKVRSFAQHYGIAILPTKPYTPRHKGKIERGIGYVKSNALKGRTFSSLAQQNHHLVNWESQVADRRIHGTTKRQVKEIFEQMEKAALLSLPASRFDLFAEALRSVRRDGHVEIKGAYYSVPPEFLGQRLWARWDGRIVRLLDQKMRLVAVHVQRPPGSFSTLDVHILPEKISGIEKGTTWLLRRVLSIGAHATQWARSMLENCGIEGVRVLMGLLSLTNKHSHRAIDRACQVAHGHGAYHLRSVRQIIDHQNNVPEQGSFEFIREGQALTQQHPIIRDLGDYGRFVREAIMQHTSLEETSP
jgi:transposase